MIAEKRGGSCENQAECWRSLFHCGQHRKNLCAFADRRNPDSLEHFQNRGAENAVRQIFSDVFRATERKLDKRNAVAPFSSYGDIRLARDGESLWCAFVGRKVATGSCLLGGIMPVATRLWRASLTISNVFVVPVRTERALVPSLDDGVGNARHLAGPIRHARHIDVGGLRNP
jgi:hypothetical protein